ncbi:MAG: TonB-dependent receptor [Bacteroidaceae bacterium]|nr:TonB-dependent receptor [Bacteroidaceae bacterium]
MKRFVLVFACLLMIVGSAMAQGRKVTGVVTDAANGNPLQGVRIFVNKTSVGTVTDAKGVFQLSVPSQHKMLTASFVGYKTLEVPVSTSMNIKMEVNQKMLDEAIVVAYGTVKKSSFTGSASDVKSEEISQHVTSNAVNAVVGKVAGLQASSTSGDPGSAPTIRIRGIGSMTADGSAPLYIVDGAPTELGINNINPQDIESISVLKDAAASAIYGARGANGVIIVTTKRAKKGQPAKITLDAKFGSNSRLVPQYDVISDPAEYYETQYRAMYNSIAYHGGTAAQAYAYANTNLLDRNNGGLGYLVYTVPKGENLIGTNFKLNPHATLGYTDGTYTYRPDNWYDETFHNSFRQEYNVSISGSEGKLSYYTSLGYLNDGGFVANSRYQRYTSRTNIDYQAKSWLKFSTNMGFTHNYTQKPSYGTTWGSSGNLFYVVNNIGPIYPLYVRDAQGNIMTQGGRKVYDSNQTGFSRPSIVGNAVRDNEFDYEKHYTDIFTGQWQAVLTPVEGLSLTANLSLQSYNTRVGSLSSTFADGSSVDGMADVSQNRTFGVNQQYLANYTRTFADVHNVSILGGYEQYKVKDQYLEGSNDHLYDPYIGELDNALGSLKRVASSYSDNLMREGFLGRVQYDYSGKYFGSASIRRDASSKFAPGHRWGTFGSIGGAWQINKETFMEPYTWVDLLKLKLSYGVQGNDAGMDDYAYADKYTTSYNTQTNEYSIKMTQKGNNNLTWESNKEINVGVEFALFKNRLNGSIEFYNRKTTDLLYNKTLPLSSGISVSTYPVNVGAMVNRGLEISLDGTPYKDENIEWSLNFNMTTNHNEITKLDPSVAKNGIKTSSYILREGGSYLEAYMVKYAGTNKATGEGLYYMDVTDDKGNVTGRTTTTDLTKATLYDLGTTLPKVSGGFGTTFKAYGFDLSAQFSFQLGGKIYDGQYQALMNDGLSAGSAMHKDLLKAWSPENPTSNIPRLSTAAPDDPGSGSQTPIDRFLTSSNYLSLNNITLGYTLPKFIVRQIKLDNIRVYLAAENLFLLTKRKGLDPRYGIFELQNSMTAGTGLASGSYASMRSVTAGVSISF